MNNDISTEGLRWLVFYVVFVGIVTLPVGLGLLIPGIILRKDGKKWAWILMALSAIPLGAFLYFLFLILSV